MMTDEQKQIVIDMISAVIADDENSEQKVQDLFKQYTASKIDAMNSPEVPADVPAENPEVKTEEDEFAGVDGPSDDEPQDDVARVGSKDFDLGTVELD